MPQATWLLLACLSLHQASRIDARIPSSNPRVIQDQYDEKKGYYRLPAGQSHVPDLVRSTVLSEQYLRPQQYSQATKLGTQSTPLRGASVHRRTPFAQPDWSYYNTVDETLRKINAIVAANPSTMSAEVKRKTLDGYSSELTVVTVEPGGRSVPRSQKIRVLMNFAQHGREIITSEVAIRLIENLSKPPAEAASAFTDSQEDARKLERMLMNVVILVSPIENINGRNLVEKGRLCERKNAHGVDTNRNWAVDWGKKEKDYDPSEEYPGKGPLSEPESAMLHELLLDFQPHAWVNVHSGMEAMFMPYDHQARIPDTQGAQAMLRILNSLNSRHCHGRCVVGSGGKSVGYLAHGTATDYIYERLQVPVVFTWEIYGDQKAHVNDCFRMFNPVTPESYEAVVSDWVGASFTLLHLLDSHPLLPAVPVSTGNTITTNTLALDQDQSPVLLQPDLPRSPDIWEEVAEQPKSFTVPESVLKVLQPARATSTAKKSEESATPQLFPTTSSQKLDQVLHSPFHRAGAYPPSLANLLILFLIGLIIGVCTIQQLRLCCLPQLRRYNRRRNREVPL